MKIIMLVAIIVITIMYLKFSIRNTYITKKQVIPSVIDILYAGVLAVFIGILTVESEKFIIIQRTEHVIYIIWLAALMIQWEKNFRNQDDEDQDDEDQDDEDQNDE